MKRTSENNYGWAGRTHDGLENIVARRTDSGWLVFLRRDSENMKWFDLDADSAGEFPNGDRLLPRVLTVEGVAAELAEIMADAHRSGHWEGLDKAAIISDKFAAIGVVGFIVADGDE